MAGTYAAPPGTPCPIWFGFLDTATNGDQPFTDYLQRVCGYCLTGLIEHAIFFFHGTGGNGKGVFINTLRGIFGTYHTTAPIDTFTVTNSTSHPTDLAGLMGARALMPILRPAFRQEPVVPYLPRVSARFSAAAPWISANGLNLNRPNRRIGRKSFAQ
jgi:hypothetical protein